MSFYMVHAVTLLEQLSKDLVRNGSMVYIQYVANLSGHGHAVEILIIWLMTEELHKRQQDVWQSLVVTWIKLDDKGPRW